VPGETEENYKKLRAAVVETDQSRVAPWCFFECQSTALEPLLKGVMSSIGSTPWYSPKANKI
jgi:hypothetical protein